MFRHLLVPLDGTNLAEAVLPAVTWIARECSSAVTLLHVLEQDAPRSVHGRSHLTTAEEATHYLQHVAEQLSASGISVHWHVHTREVRQVAHSLVAHADEFEPDLVVMCTHGEGRFRDWFIGNIPQQVVSQGIRPVLTFRVDDAGSIRFPFRRILVPLDGRRDHEQGIEVAAALARLSEVPLELLTIVPTADTLSGSESAVGSLLPEATRMMLELTQQDAAKYLGEKIEQLKGLGVVASAVVSRGEPVREIIQIAGDSADLIVLGTHGKVGTGAFWAGSIGQKLLRRIPTSFLLAPLPG